MRETLSVKFFKYKTHLTVVQLKISTIALYLYKLITEILIVSTLGGGIKLDPLKKPLQKYLSISILAKICEKINIEEDNKSFMYLNI